ncbi:hypothetical protein BGX29_000874, partial [Mortierella sp. GBA35]
CLPTVPVPSNPRTSRVDSRWKRWLARCLLVPTATTARSTVNPRRSTRMLRRAASKC